MNIHAPDFDFDALKSGLHALEQRLARQEQLDWQRARHSGIARLQWGLWPLWLGQTLQMLLGLACIVLGVSVWSHLRDGSAMFYSAVLVHAYGVICVVMGGIALGMLAKIDRADPLTATQLKLARLRRFYIISGMVVGLAWWLFWIPFVATLFFWLSGGRVNFYANMGQGIAVMMVVGVFGLFATAWLHRWSRSPERPRLARAMDAAVTGHSLRRAQRQVDELRAFERDE